MDRFVISELDLMKKSALLTILIFGLYPIVSASICVYDTPQPDSVLNRQILYNGRIWKNLNYSVSGDPYFLTNAFLTGTVTISGKTFSPLRLKYNLFEGEILTPIPSGEILQLNREMVDSFSLFHENKIYRFAVIPEDSMEGIAGYVQVLYSGKADLVVRHNKKIKRSDFENKPDKYYKVSRIFYVRNKQSFLISGKRDLFNLAKDNKPAVRDFMRKNKFRVSKNNPESFIPVIRYMDSIN